MVCVLTQNVDGLHADAGSRNLIEIHGTVHRLRCSQAVRMDARCRITPACRFRPNARCGGVMRPDVVLFGEPLPPRAIERLEHVLQDGVDLSSPSARPACFYIAGPVVAPGPRAPACRASRSIPATPKSAISSIIVCASGLPRR